MGSCLEALTESLPILKILQDLEDACLGVSRKPREAMVDRR